MGVEQDRRVVGLPCNGEDEGKVVKEGDGRSQVQATRRRLLPHRRRHYAVLEVRAIRTALFKNTNIFLHRIVVVVVVVGPLETVQCSILIPSVLTCLLVVLCTLDSQPRWSGSAVTRSFIPCFANLGNVISWWWPQQTDTICWQERVGKKHCLLQAPA